MKRFVAAFVAMLALTAPAFADFAKVQTRSDFVALVANKTLGRPLVKLQVTPDGQIRGKGAAWSVTGSWKWEDGYFCRTLIWGGDDLGYNCQQITVDGTRIRFTSDRGTGESAEFQLR